MMRKGRNIAIGLMLAVCGFAELANAKSRFEASDEAPLVAVVKLDFTIVIPEVLTLRVDRNAIASEAPKAVLVLTVPAMVAHFDADEAIRAPMPRAHATTNAGTLAFGTPVPENDSGDYEALKAPQIPVSSTLADIEPPEEAAPMALSSPAMFLIALP